MRATAAQNQALSFSLVREGYAQAMSGLAARYAPYGKPISFRPFVQSHRDYFLTGWIEDAHDCGASCVEQTLTTDFPVQAIGYEAALEAITSSGVDLAAVDTPNYWYTDALMPGAWYPNISQSVRNKPAESIFAAWFRQP